MVQNKSAGPFVTSVPILCTWAPVNLTPPRDEKLVVVDHCPRNLLDLSAVELSGLGSLASATLGLGALLSSGLKSAAWLTLIQNSSKRTCEMIILFDTTQDR